MRWPWSPDEPEPDGEIDRAGPMADEAMHEAISNLERAVAEAQRIFAKPPSERAGP